METLKLNTTQNVSLEFPMASIADRIVAYFLDLLVILFYFLAVRFGLFKWIGLSTDWWIIFFILPILFYHLIFELLFNGQSPGKRMMKMRVFNEDGGHLSTGSCIIRWLFRLADITLTTGVMATVSIIITKKGQRLGDIAARTIVLKTGEKAQFHETLWMDVSDDYQPRFPEAELLSDKDVQVIKEVLQTSSNTDNSLETVMKLLTNTRKAIEKKTNAQSNLSNKEYLTSMIKDYNAFHRQNI
jgi:uncharacterized RDD family membrane protein YckC